MDIATRMALTQSIQHWREVVADPLEAKTGRLNCALCELFNSPKVENVYCQGCPVAASTGKPGCEGTPYDDYSQLKLDLKFAYIAKGEPVSPLDLLRLEALAQSELDFLISLQPSQPFVYADVGTVWVVSGDPDSNVFADKDTALFFAKTVLADMEGTRVMKRILYGWREAQAA